MKYKAFIPSAGLGTRLGELGKNINKALVSVANKATISHIIEKFPKNIEIVIALGHRGDLVHDYIELAHPDRKIQFVNIDPYCGPGSGLGETILQCQEYLQCPFVFCSNDTLVVENIPAPRTNWMGFDDSIEVNNSYRSIQIYDGWVERICEKEEKRDSSPYIGLAGIHDYEHFWKCMKGGIKYGSIQAGESYGLHSMLNGGSKIEACLFTWLDTGQKEGLERARNFYKKGTDPHILHKPNEAIWFANDMVIKYSADKDFIKNRAERTKQLEGLVPEIVSVRENMYSYKLVKGNVISKVITSPLFEKFLDWSVGLWTPFDLDKKAEKDFKQRCLSFYKDKTYDRVNKYFNRFEKQDSREIVNDIKVPKLHDLLSKVDWNELSQGIPVRYHGDFHFENILVAENGDFVLLDWRQDFGGLREYGDIYYDFAKLLHGIKVSHELVNRDLYSVDNDAGIVKFDILTKNSLILCEEVFRKWIIANGYDWKRVKLLTALIFLNIAPLHHHPYSELLFYLGKYQLHQTLESSANE